MIYNAPKFYEIAKQIVHLTTNKIFVAHNSNFDYGFIKNEFEQLGYYFHRKTICTVELSRKLLPGHRSYSLGNLCNDLNISINGRHRAEGDALATVELFKRLLQQYKSIGYPTLFK
jgi:DNA polymerase III subunit epsilon